MVNANDVDSNKVITQTQGNARHIIRNNPKKLNILYLEAVATLNNYFRIMEASTDNNVIILSSAEGRAFSAGGDMKRAIDGIVSEGDKQSSLYTYVTDFYRMLYFIGTMKTPMVTVLNGIAMGSGAMMAAFSPFRVATEKSSFGMAEVSFGLFADGGSNFILPKMDRCVGIYLGLTGVMLKAEDLLFCGLATHFIESKDLEAVYNELSKTLNPSHDVVNKILEKFSVDLNYKPSSYTLWGKKMNVIERCFRYSTVEEIIKGLRRDGSEFALNTINQMLNGCPSTLKVTMESLRIGSYSTASQCLNIERHLWSIVTRQPNFREGVVAKLVERRKPVWNPSTIEDIDLKDIRDFFFTLNHNESIIYDTRKDYYYMPYNNYMLPSSAEIQKVYQNQNGNLERTISWFLENRQWKFGVKEKINDVVKNLETIHYEQIFTTKL